MNGESNTTQAERAPIYWMHEAIVCAWATKHSAADRSLIMWAFNQDIVHFSVHALNPVRPGHRCISQLNTRLTQKLEYVVTNHETNDKEI
jgi:hypothetical protein